MKEENIKQTSNELLLDPQLLRKSSLVLRAIRHKLRQQMIKLIHEKKRITVTEIYVKLRIEQSVASQHLAILRKAKFVVTEREGKNIYYSVNYAYLNEVSKLLGNILNN